jgi:hypothetical protein
LLSTAVGSFIAPPFTEDAWLDFNERAGRSAAFRFLPAALFLADFFAIAVPPLS